jgi:4'-phosphopantetheinyl transferase
VHVLLHRVDAQGSGLDLGAVALLPAAERDHAAGIAASEDRSRYVAGRSILRVAAGKILGVAPHNVPLRVTEGRVVLDAAHNLHVSIAHSGELVGCALARRRVGVDLQRIDAPPDATLVRRTCTAAETAAVTQAADSTEAFHQIWVRKEAIGKALGIGLALPLRQVDVRGRHPTGLADLNAWRLADLDVGVGYAAAVALESRFLRLRISDLATTRALVEEAIRRNASDTDRVA